MKNKTKIIAPEYFFCQLSVWMVIFFLYNLTPFLIYPPFPVQAVCSTHTPAVGRKFCLGFSSWPAALPPHNLLLLTSSSSTSLTSSSWNAVIHKFFLHLARPHQPPNLLWPSALPPASQPHLEFPGFTSPSTCLQSPSDQQLIGSTTSLTTSFWPAARQQLFH